MWLGPFERCEWVLSLKQIKVLSVFGTRPEAIKMAPVVLELSKKSPSIVSLVLVTAQHREMLDQVIDYFKIKDRKSVV